ESHKGFRNCGTQAPGHAKSSIPPDGILGIHSSETLGIHPTGTLGIHPAGTLGIHPTGTLGIHPAGTLGIYPAGTPVGQGKLCQVTAGEGSGQQGRGSNSSRGWDPWHPGQILLGKVGAELIQSCRDTLGPGAGERQHLAGSV
uniref:Uncharacterized protein n=1 Tax=Serinus canaria TaxID=9135 RepID=A0A8C9MIC5_SERCA